MSLMTDVSTTLFYGTFIDSDDIFGLVIDLIKRWKLYKIPWGKYIWENQVGEPVKLYYLDDREGSFDSWEEWSEP